LRTLARETWIGVGAAALGIGAMAVDHLLEEGGGFAADPPTFVISAAIVLVATGLLFGRVIPGVKRSAEPANAAITPGFVCSAIGVFTLPLTLWLGFPFPVGAATLALGLIAREGTRKRPALLMAVIGGLVVGLGAVGYAGVAVDKLT
jgi:hypothetical protein